VVLPTLAPTGAGGMAHAANAVSATKRFPDHWLAPDVQGALYAMQGRVCGYCGVRLGANDPGDVEHFRPKSKVTNEDHPGYWWVAYAFSNYVFACRVCNSSRKGNHFPLRDPATRAGDPNADLSTEARTLYHPAEDDLDEVVQVDVQHVCRIAARPAVDASRLAAVVAFFDLDRADLCKERLAVCDATVDLIEGGNLLAATRLASRYAPHSATALAVLVGAGYPPPSREQEHAWHVADLVRQLDVALDLVESEADPGVRAKREAEALEAAWALAAVWHDPSAGTPAEVEAALTARGIADLIRPLRDQLDV
jgi:uncharacterized protein (TIGR02646 family)